MTDSGWLFLNTPLPYLGAMYFLAYRHDLGRIARPFRDLSDSSEWHAVFKRLDLVGTDLLVSSRSERDTQEYLSTLESVYGVLNVVRAPAKPDLLRQIPNLAGLVAQSPAQKAALGGRTRRLARGAGRLASTIRRRLPRGSAR
ncbi:MAG: hypothetical protein JRN51_09695 [Nitrososphaerota archaeon]|nr:hypothetical protein [Nitrososphaerota archaeon]